MSSGEIPLVDPDRADEVDRRHHQLAEFLSETGHDGMLLTRPHNLAWLSVGGESRRGAGETTFSAFITPEARVLLASNVDSGQLFDREVNGLGFQLKERPWHEPREVLWQDLCRGRQVASDCGFSGTSDVESRLSRMRMILTESECGEMRSLGRSLARAVEATARDFDQGDTEAEVAGQLAHRLHRYGISPERLQVMSDGQGHRYRHWGFGNDRVERTCIISAVGRRRGLHVAATRTVAFGQPTRSILDTHHLATIIQTSGMFFSRADWPVADVWARVARIYEKFDAPDEWREAEQAEGIGYASREHVVRPQSQEPLQTRTAWFWHPTVRTAATGDTILVREDGFELLTSGDSWPQLLVQVKGTRIERPDILIRDSSTDWPDA